ncbi:MAG: hypothetical protein Q9216_006969 [Gyalolechia sp. 2 TL-2023]
MMAKKWAHTHLPAYELIHRRQPATQPFPPPLASDDDLVKSTSKLPPKPLPGRPKYRPFIVASSITITTIVTLVALIAMIPGLVPEGDWDGMELKGTSCDLVDTKNSSRLQSAFQINLRGGAQLNFAEAKLIDLFFDLLVGQGGRFLMAAISYIVFMDALLRSMEITPIPYKLYASLVFSSTSLIATWHSIRAVSTTKGWRAKTYLIWSALAMLYVLIFPTLIETATGYVSPSSAGFNVENGTMITADSNDLISCLNVTGGLLLGQDENITVAEGPPAHIFDPLESQSYSGLNKDRIPDSIDHTTLYYALLTAHPDMIYNATNSTKSPYSECRAQQQNVYNSSECIYLDFDSNFTTKITINTTEYTLNNAYPSSLWNHAYCYNELTLRPNQLRDVPYCFAQSYFVWGFSSVLLYVILGLQIIWTLGMFCVWLDANIASELVRNGRTIRGHFRAAADLVEAMNKTLGHEYCAYSEKELANGLDKSGDRLRYNTISEDDRDGLLHVGVTTSPSARVLVSDKRLYGGKDTARRRIGTGDGD